MDLDALITERVSLLPAYWRPIVQRLRREHGSDGLSLTLPRLLHTIRDMPYGRPVGDVLGPKECLTQWRGTCSTKHLAAYELLEILGLNPKMWLDRYQLDFTQPYYSTSLRHQAADLTVNDVHNYLTCELLGRSSIIDVTFPKCLKAYGLPVTESWTVGNDFVLCCVPEETREVRTVQDANRIKREWLSVLNRPPAAKLRETAIQALMEVASFQSLASPDSVRG